jgi:hypothetical protein
LEPIEADLSAFKIGYRTRKGVDLTGETTVSAPDRYDATQKLGSRMREAGVEAFRYASARDADGGTNVGLFTPRAFTSKRPGAMQVWRATASKASVEMRRHDLLRNGDVRVPARAVPRSREAPPPGDLGEGQWRGRHFGPAHCWTIPVVM